MSFFGRSQHVLQYLFELFGILELPVFRLPAVLSDELGVGLEACKNRVIVAHFLKVIDP